MCDGAALNGQTCEGQGYDSGVLACGMECQYDASGCVSLCGNGVSTPDEPCDDGNLTSGDGCSSLCTVEAGWDCQGDPSICVPICGDGLMLGAEACDDGGLIADDGCSAACTVETGWQCAGRTL